MIEPVKKQNPEHNVHAAIGGFIYEFELMMFEMREIIHMILKNHNLSNYRLGVILLHDATGKPMVDYVRGFIYEAYKNRIFIDPTHQNDNYALTVEGTYIKKLLDKIKEASELRNDIVHATWVVNPNYETDEPTNKFLGIRYKITSGGVKPKFDKQDYTIASFTKLYDYLKTLNHHLDTLSINIGFANALNTDLNVADFTSMKFEFEKIEEK